LGSPLSDGSDRFLGRKNLIWEGTGGCFGKWVIENAPVETGLRGPRGRTSPFGAGDDQNRNNVIERLFRPLRNGKDVSRGSRKQLRFYRSPEPVGSINYSWEGMHGISGGDEGLPAETERNE
jgi:hypothetical protein